MPPAGARASLGWVGETDLCEIIGPQKAGPKEQVAIAFARQVAEQVADAMRSGECLGFALVAAPRFLGVLRSEIGTLVNAEPYASIDKEVVGSDEAVIEKLLELS